jgi:hypothetical protein
VWGLPLLNEGLLAPQKGLCSMYLLVPSISIGKIPGKLLKMCETNTVCWGEFGYVCGGDCKRSLSRQLWNVTVTFTASFCLGLL